MVHKRKPHWWVRLNQWMGTDECSYLTFLLAVIALVVSIAK